MARSPEHKGRVMVTAWFRKDGLEALRLELLPMSKKDGKPVVTMAEVLLFSRHIWFDGLRLPRRITVLHAGLHRSELKLIKRSGIVIKEFNANPKIDASIFRMKKN